MISDHRPSQATFRARRAALVGTLAHSCKMITVYSYVLAQNTGQRLPAYLISSPPRHTVRRCTALISRTCCVDLSLCMVYSMHRNLHAHLASPYVLCYFLWRARAGMPASCMPEMSSLTVHAVSVPLATTTDSVYLPCI